MTPLIGNNSNDLSLLTTAYEIGNFIQSQNPTNLEYSSRFCDGPIDCHRQTKKGLMLELTYGVQIHTPYGLWRILDNKSGSKPMRGEDKIFEAIKQSLGLKLIQEAKINYAGKIGPSYAITKWEGQEIEDCIYRKYSEYISYDKVKEIWQDFTKKSGMKEKFSQLFISNEKE